MRFLTKAECEDFAKPLGKLNELLDWRAFGRMKKKHRFYYESRLKSSVGAELVQCLGTFSFALLWTHSLVWGDRSADLTASDDWRRYGQWRSKLGADHGLFELPGQLFGADEHEVLSEGIAWTIYTGSDAIILPKPTRTIVHLSHDDMVCIDCRSTLAGLDRLEKVGLHRAQCLKP